MPRKKTLNIIKNQYIKNKKVKLMIYKARNVIEDVTTHDIGNLTITCIYCAAKYFKMERLGQICCHNGKINADICPNLEIPNFFLKLFNDETERGIHFQKFIRNYNNAFAFASVKVNLLNQGNYGPYCYKICGQMYHFVDALHPEDNDPSYAALFILDSDIALQHRISNSCNINLRPEILEELQNNLTICNPYVQLFYHMKDIESNNLGKEYNLIFNSNNTFDKRRYNISNSNEIAAAFITDSDGRPPSHIDFIIYSKHQGKQIISGLNPHTDPMVYPLLFPCGDPGWKQGLSHSNINATPIRNITTQLQYYCYRLRITNNLNIIHNAGKLFQQYLVDAYIRVESSRLAYIKTHQKDLRVETYSGLRDYIHLEAQNQGVKPGIPTILPSTFIGSARNMFQNYQDAMCIVSKYGKPDLFITFTANPNWPEIKNNLNKGNTVSNRPDIVARVFSLKLQSLMDEIIVDEIFGKIDAYIYVIEFQKRGLPHAHILIILNSKNKIESTEEIDKIVCAEIPDKENNKKLFDIITKFMIHNPCGEANENAVCMENGKCIRNFPKEFSNETLENKNGYPIYKRRLNKTIIIRGKQIDNRWVVPFNPYLSIRYEAHINVEICSSIKSIKYLFKYVYKGYDCATLSLKQIDGDSQLNADEITSFLNMRYVSSSEAVWRLFEKPMHKRSHSIERLCVHLPNEQYIVFAIGEENEALQRANQKCTKLMAWFNLNNTDNFAKRILYKHIPEYYCWNNNKWNRRKKNCKVIGRMYTISPKDKERYFLRLLLLHIPGAISFDHLKTVNEYKCSTFEETAKKLMLLASDDEWFNCLEEACLWQTASQLRELFAFICIFNNPQNPYLLWQTFRDFFCEDFLRHYSENDGYNLGLYEIEQILNGHNINCFTIGLPKPIIQVEECTLLPQDIMVDSIANSYYLALNKDQKQIADEILEAVIEKKSGLYYIDGPGGTGKTFLYITLCNMLKEKRKIVIPVAWTGIAANLLPGGRTAHSVFKFPIPLFEDSISTLSHKSVDAIHIKNSSLIIWDEISMTPNSALKVLDRLLRELMDNEENFGGKLIVFGGDFRQILPVVTHGTRTNIIEHSIKHNNVWQLFKKRYLTMNMRTSENEIKFSNWLQKLGEGTLKVYNDIGPDYIKIPNQCVSDKDIVREIFTSHLDNNSLLNINNMNSIFNHCILCPKNDQCAEINDKVLTLMEGESKTYLSADNIVSDEVELHNQFPAEFLNSLTPSGLPPHKLKLKIGSIVILLRNLNAKQGLVNGTRMVILKFLDFSINCQIITGELKGKYVCIPRLTLTANDYNLPFKLERRQFPIKLAFAMSINKSQGQTFDKVGLYLPTPVFSHGHLYVAFSRVKTIKDIKVALCDGVIQQKYDNEIVTFTKNIVYREII